MKRAGMIIGIFLIVLAALAISGCFSEASPEPEEPAEEGENHAPETERDGGAKFIEPFSEPVEPAPILETTLRRNESGLPVVTNPNSILVLVNKERNLPSDYEPDDLVRPEVPFPFEGDMPRKLMRSGAAAALEELVDAASEEGLELYASSGYRSYSTQRDIFAYNAKTRGEDEANRFSARGGQSEHQTGLAMDVTCPEVGFELVQRFGETAEGRWVADNAHRFGFIVRYPRGDEEITGYAYEPWHLRYVGERHARRIHEMGVTFEEYMENR
ncbi:MAG: M15 family metallopeptidase [Bacillota bacterium]